MGGGGEGGGVHMIWLIPYNDKRSEACHSLTQQTAKVGVNIEGCFRVTSGAYCSHVRVNAI